VKDLEQFSEERLKAWISDDPNKTYHVDGEDLQYLARIALAAKQAKPVYQIEDADDWHDCEKEEYESLIKSQGIHPMYYRVLFTTPQPAHTEQVIPDGWKLVPIEPTEAMKKAYYDSSLAPISKLSVTGYRDLIAAPPKPESE